MTNEEKHVDLVKTNLKLCNDVVDTERNGYNIKCIVSLATPLEDIVWDKEHKDVIGNIEVIATPIIKINDTKIVDNNVTNGSVI